MRRMRPALADGRSLLGAVLDDGKAFVGAEELRDGRAYDIVVCDRVGAPVLGAPPDLEGYVSFVTEHNAAACG